MLQMKNTSSLPSPASISYWWAFGSLLGLCLIIQLSTGVFLAMQYVGESGLSFTSVASISQDVNWGWALRVIHANGASFFFMCLYLHLGRGLYYSGTALLHVWEIGVTIFLMTMATAFLGYVLPWGQMSFWGASVITSLIQAIPYLGVDTVLWLWGGYSVDSPTLTRFFALHYLLPFFLLMLVLGHLFLLHAPGSSNPCGINSNVDKIDFHSLFTTKDILGYSISMSMFFYVLFIAPAALSDPENFIQANPLITPVHIQPEWYFLFAYAILRSIPNKLGGVIALTLSVLILYVVPFFNNCSFQSSVFNKLMNLKFWALTSIIFLLTWIGARPVEPPYVSVGQTLTFFYFFLYLVPILINKLQNSILLNHTCFLKTVH